MTGTAVEKPADPAFGRRPEMAGLRLERIDWRRRRRFTAVSVLFQQAKQGKQPKPAPGTLKKISPRVDEFPVRSTKIHRLAASRCKGIHWRSQARGRSRPRSLLSFRRCTMTDALLDRAGTSDQGVSPRRTLGVP